MPLNGYSTSRLDQGSGRQRGGPEAVHQEVQQAIGLGFVLAPWGPR
ncbi:hypothetical protein AB0L30_39205 [Microbispora rosea]